MSENTIKNYIDKVMLNEYLKELNHLDRRIIILYYWWGYRDTEIGEIINLSQQLVNYRRNKVIKQLRKENLKKEFH